MLLATVMSSHMNTPMLGEVLVLSLDQQVPNQRVLHSTRSTESGSIAACSIAPPLLPAVLLLPP